MLKKYKSEKAITLIALVITIIVLIILAGVSINLVLGDNGIITKTKEAKNTHTKEQEKEVINLAVAASQMYNDSAFKITKANLEKEIKNQLGNDANISVIENGSNNFTIKMNDTDRTYYVESTGNVIDDENILEISTAEELKAFRDEVNNGNTFEGKVICLTNNITLDINEEWIPIGYYSMTSTGITDPFNKPFKGSFEGNGYQINGIYINTSDKVKGLFGFVDGAQIKNLGIGMDCDITGGNNTGGIVGSANNTTIYNCYNKCIIKGSGNTGGICGTSINSSIYNCFNIGKIQASQSNAGGICGNSDGSDINNCYNTGEIIATNNVGGICGQTLNSSNIENCYNIGELKISVNDKKHIGPIVGYNIQGNLKNNYYLSGCIEEMFSSNQAIQKDENELKNITQLLGDFFKEDTENINNGYPILSWQ